MGDIETRLFRYFVALAEEQHFARAALHLGITPPTLTHQIKKLERELGTKLVERRGNTRVLLTEAGVRFFAQAQQVLRQVEHATAVARKAERGELGHLDIGFLTGMSFAGLLRMWLGEFQRANPAIDISMRKLIPTAQIAAIMRKELDAGFTHTPHKYPAGIQGFEIYRQPLVLALPSEHPLAHSKDITPAMLKDETFVNISPKLEVGFWDYTETIAEMGNFTPRVVKRNDDFITILTYVALGYGMAVVPKVMSRMNVRNAIFREIAANPVPSTSNAFVYRRDASPAAKLLIKHMRRHALPRQQTGASMHT
jgi:DNA-binding transcriptional LysR family regulator